MGVVMDVPREVIKLRVIFVRSNNLSIAFREIEFMQTHGQASFSENQLGAKRSKVTNLLITGPRIS